MNSKSKNELLKRLERYYEKRKEKSLYFYPIALLYSRMGEYQKAYQYLLEGLRYFPRYVLALIMIAKILMNEGKYKAAVAYLETALNIERDEIRALEALAECHEKMGEIDKAIEDYERLVELDPSNERAKSKLLELAPAKKPSPEDVDSLIEELAEEKGEDNVDIPKVELEEEEGAEESDEEEIPTISLARLYEKQGHIDDAIRVYERILEREPDNGEALEELKRLKRLKEQGNED